MANLLCCAEFICSLLWVCSLLFYFFFNCLKALLKKTSSLIWVVDWYSWLAWFELGWVVIIISCIGWWLGMINGWFGFCWYYGSDFVDGIWWFVMIRMLLWLLEWCWLNDEWFEWLIWMVFLVCLNDIVGWWWFWFWSHGVASLMLNDYDGLFGWLNANLNLVKFN